MPLYQISSSGLVGVSQANFNQEKELQHLIESSLPTVFGARLIATEFSTGSFHGGRIDTLALSADNNPIILEYKKVESSELINQSLYYLCWLRDHKGDFEVAARESLGDTVQVDWSDVRVICLAPKYKKYDLLAVQVMGVNIELWRYQRFANEHLYLEEVFRQSSGQTELTTDSGKNPVMVAAGKKAAVTKATGNYTFDEHLEGRSDWVRTLAIAIQEFISGLDDLIQEVPKMHYIVYKTTRNIVCMEIRPQRILLFLKLNPKSLLPLPPNARDMTGIGHQGTGDLELKIETIQDFEAAKTLMEMAYQAVTQP